MRAKAILTLLGLGLAAWDGDLASAQTNVPPSPPTPAQGSAAARTNATPPPSAPAQRSEADLERLVAPIALYPDPLIATILPASVYPLEIVEAARFVKDTNNIAKLDAQPWDANVKAVARVPEVIAQMNESLDWTKGLGQAFLEQQSEVMAAVQSMRAKAQKAGTLKTTPEQVVVVTNVVVEQTVQEKVVVVTNTVVQIQPSNPEVVYVPTYDPGAVYYPAPAYYVGPPPVVTFAAGVAVGAVIANNCDWHGGGVYVGHHGAAVWGGGWGHDDVDIDVNRDVNVNQNFNRTANANQNVNRSANQDVNRNAQGQKWQPDQNRLSNSGAPAATRSAESRGWSSGTAAGTGAASPAVGTTAGSGGTSYQDRRASGASASQGSASRPTPTPSQQGSRPTPAASQQGSRPTPTPSQQGSSASRPTPTASRPTQQNVAAQADRSAFSGVDSGAQARAASQRGSVSRGGGGGARGGGGGRR
jgi:hypothetical protein